jgi:DNA-binding XRE family transcriptional regulator
MASYVTASAHIPSALAERVKAAQLPPVAARREIRCTARATLRDLADELGVSPMTVLRWEQGRTVPRLAHAIAYRRLLDQLAEATS